MSYEVKEIKQKMHENENENECKKNFQAMKIEWDMWWKIIKKRFRIAQLDTKFFKSLNPSIWGKIE